jgi:hypothetical protein
MKLMLRFCGIPKELDVSREFVEGTAAFDLRSELDPKAPVPKELGSTQPYRQTFEAKHGFVPRMSIIDLLMNMGPETLAILGT